jgi:hypothetical protein
MPIIPCAVSWWIDRFLESWFGGFRLLTFFGSRPYSFLQLLPPPLPVRSHLRQLHNEMLLA